MWRPCENSWRRCPPGLPSPAPAPPGSPAPNCLAVLFWDDAPTRASWTNPCTPNSTHPRTHPCLWPQALFDHIPVGVGSQGIIPTTARDLDEALEMGMDWSLREVRATPGPFFSAQLLVTGHGGWRARDMLRVEGWATGWAPGWAAMPQARPA